MAEAVCHDSGACAPVPMIVIAVVVKSKSTTRKKCLGVCHHEPFSPSPPETCGPAPSLMRTWPHASAVARAALLRVIKHMSTSPHASAVAHAALL